MASSGKCQQKDYDKLNFSEVDSFVLKIKYEQDYIKLAKDLAAPFPDDILKLRAIFKWITNNISYDYRFINSGKEVKMPDCDDRYDCPEIMRSWENDFIKKVLRNRKATCDGYAKLLQKLCELNHIRAEVVPGYARTKPYQIGNKMSVNHAWNAVFIDTSWYFVDATWAAGYCIENDETGRLIKFVKEFREYYWLTAFKRLARDHFPKNPYWGEQHRMSTSDFFNMPYYYSTEILENISNESQPCGMLTAKKSDTLHFCFEYKKDIRRLQINSNNFRNPSLWMLIPVSRKKSRLVPDKWAEKKQVYIPFEKTGDQYRFDYIVKDVSLYYLELIFDYKKAIRYKIRVTK